MNSRLSPALALLLAAAQAPAQTPAPARQQTPTPPSRQGPAPTQTPTPEEDSDDDVVRITSNLVQFDAVVTDKQGRHVADLRPDDFEVFADGRRQEITNFTFVAGPPAPYDPGPRTDVTRLQAGSRPQLGLNLAPGDYVLQLVVTGEPAKGGHATATQWLDFEVVN
jgi:hypothetical protein